MSEAWKGRYPYQVEVSRNGTVHSFAGARKLLSGMEISWHDMLDGELAQSLSRYLENPDHRLKIIKNTAVNKPRLESTTLWDYPLANLWQDSKGEQQYAGVTPAFVIYNMVKRYTEPGDLVLDPMAGSGTTLDVCQRGGTQLHSVRYCAYST